MKHFLILMAGLLSIPTFAAMRPQTGTVFEHEGIRYAVVEDQSPAVSVVKPAAREIEMAFIPETVTYGGVSYTVSQIETSAFEASPNLFLIELPRTITDIGNYAFYNCPLLDIDELPAQLLTIGDYAFAKMPQLKKVTLPLSTESIGIGAFSDNEALERATLFSAVKSLPAKAFSSCPVLREVYLPDGLEELGRECFLNDYAISELILPPGLKRIYAKAIPGYAPEQKGLRNLVIPNSVEYIDPSCFSSTAFISVRIGDGLEEIPAGAFNLCYELKDIKLPANLKKIGQNAFSRCAANASRSVTEIDIPSTVTEIGKNAFFDTRILSISTGDGVTELTSGTLGKPRAVHLGASVRNIAKDAMDMSELVLITCDAATPPVVSDDFPVNADAAGKINLIVKDEVKKLYEKHPRWNIFNVVGEKESVVEVTLDGKKALGEAIYEASGQLPSRISSLTVHGTLSETDIRVITENMYSLSALDLGDTDLTEIPSGMFQGFKNLKKMVLPSHLRSIGNSAFSGCYSMSLEELPETLESIGKDAFLDCASITINHLPESLRTIGYSAFNGCSSIRSMISNDRLESIGIAAFGSCDLLEYADFSNCRVTEMDYTFYICRNLKTVLLPQRLEKLRDRVLAITAVESVEIPGTVKMLGKETFFKSPLRVLSLGENLTSIPTEFLSEARDIVSLSLPSTLSEVNTRIMPNSSRLRALSCRAIDAPAAQTGAFSGVQTQKCTLTVPAQSFFSYLNAPQWGAFGHLENTLDVAINGDGDVTMLPEDEYKDIIESEEAKEVVKDYDESATARVMSRARATQLSDLASGKHFAALFDGAQLNSESNKKGYRVFINNVPLDEIEAVTLNGEDITSQMEGNSVLLPAAAVGKLVINMKTSRIDAIEGDDVEGAEIWYTLSGLRLDKRPQTPGVYVRRHGNKAEKIVIR